MFIFINRLLRHRRFLLAVGLDMNAGGEMTGMTGRVDVAVVVVVAAAGAAAEATRFADDGLVDGFSDDVADEDDDRADDDAAARIGLLAGVAVFVTTSSSGLG